MLMLGIQHARDAGNSSGLPVMLLVYENGMGISEQIAAVESIPHAGNPSSSPPCSRTGNGGFIMNSLTSTGHGGSGWRRINSRTSDSLQWNGSSSGRYIIFWPDYATCRARTGIGAERFFSTAKHSGRRPAVAFQPFTIRVTFLSTSHSWAVRASLKSALISSGVRFHSPSSNSPARYRRQTCFSEG